MKDRPEYIGEELKDEIRRDPLAHMRSFIMLCTMIDRMMGEAADIAQAMDEAPEDVILRSAKRYSQNTPATPEDEAPWRDGFCHEVLRFRRHLWEHYAETSTGWGQTMYHVVSLTFKLEAALASIETPKP